MALSPRGGLNVRLAAIGGVTQRGVLKAPFHLQCPPMEELSVDWGYEHQDYMTLRSGEFSRRGGRKLRTVAFDTLAVDGRYNWQSPKTKVSRERQREALRDVLISGTPFHLLVAQTGGYADGASVRVDMPATLRTLRVTERAGEPDTFYFACGFVEFRAARVSRGGGGAGGKGAKRPSKKKWPQEVVLKANGTYSGIPKRVGPLTLFDLALLVYGDPGLVATVAKNIGVTNWGSHTPLIQYRAFKGKGGTITLKEIPGGPKAPAPTVSTYEDSRAGLEGLI